MHNAIKTIILSSLGGRSHERLAKVYKRNHHTENITSLSLQYLERSTIRLEKDSEDKYQKSKPINSKRDY